MPTRFEFTTRKLKKWARVVQFLVVNSNLVCIYSLENVKNGICAQNWPLDTDREISDLALRKPAKCSITVLERTASWPPTNMLSTLHWHWRQPILSTRRYCLHFFSVQIPQIWARYCSRFSQPICDSNRLAPGRAVDCIEQDSLARIVAIRDSECRSRKK